MCSDLLSHVVQSLCGEEERRPGVMRFEGAARNHVQTLKVCLHLMSMLTFASNFNIVSMVMLPLTQRMTTEPILCICFLLLLLLLFSKK